MQIRYKSSKAAFFDGIRAMQSALGGAGSIVALVLVILVLLSLGWFADAAYALAFKDRPAWWGLIPFSVVVLIVFTFSRSVPELVPDIQQNISKPAKAMIMFLSFTKVKKELGFEKSDFEGDSWEMPITAITEHWQRAKLEHIVVLTSSGDSGTWKDLEKFHRTIDDIVGVPLDKVISLPQYAHGINFENAEELHHAVNDALDFLRKKQVASQDIVIDITGGQKVPAVVAGVVGLGEGLRLQYVSTKDKRMLEYDITMKVER